MNSPVDEQPNLFVPHEEFKKLLDLLLKDENGQIFALFQQFLGLPWYVEHLVSILLNKEAIALASSILLNRAVLLALLEGSHDELIFGQIIRALNETHQDKIQENLAFAAFHFYAESKKIFCSKLQMKHPTLFSEKQYIHYTLLHFLILLLTPYLPILSHFSKTILQTQNMISSFLLHL